MSCDSCQSDDFRFILEKKSPLEIVYQVHSCLNCGLVQVNPRPSLEELSKYYTDNYFTQRTDRGYDNYYSEKIQKEIERVFKLNLQDSGFYDWERKSKLSKRSLDIGCAAGYFVKFLKDSGYDSMGIEIAEGPSQYARQKLGLNVLSLDFLEWDTKQNFSVITLWATIEHLYAPYQTLKKIYELLLPGGVLLLSTCRYGTLAKWKGVDWRYLNVPEHLFYYSLVGIKRQLEKIGYVVDKSFTYGSGMTSKNDAGPWFRMKKRILDSLVKWTNQGDMMVVLAKKP